MRVLLANPFFLSDSALEQRLMTLYFPVGLLYLATAAREAGHTVAVFDGTFAAGDQAFAGALDEHAPDVVGISSLVTLRPATLRLARAAADAGATVVVGGPDATAVPDAYLEEPAIRCVVIGEGEATLVELLATLEAAGDLQPVAGIAFRSRDGGVRRSAGGEPILALDDLAWPARDLIDVRRYLAAWESAHSYSSLSVAASRGCAFGCEYCGESALGPHIRRRSPEGVAAEMRHLQAAYGPDRFRLVDDLDGLGRDWLLALGQAMIQMGVVTPYEGLRPAHLGHLPMLVEGRDVCADRNAWLPTRGAHPHAPPAMEQGLLQRRWRERRLLEGEHLEDP